MPYYEFFCHACKKPFSRTLTPTEIRGRQGRLSALWQRGSGAEMVLPGCI